MHYLTNGFQIFKQCYHRITPKNTLLPLQDISINSCNVMSVHNILWLFSYTPLY